ncbi:MAG: family N-acetyltransferase [Lachnospiraceae bacterium]|jgi:hypothetical protein|nr:family N-acetyltransferase [Lachnospiraceae bacterium]
MSVYGKFYSVQEKLEDVIEVRSNLRTNKEIMDDMVLDENDKNAVHVVIYASNYNNKAISTGRLLYTNNLYSISKIFTIMCEEWEEYEELAVRMLVNKAFNLGAKEVYADIHTDKLLMYKKIGFLTSGNTALCIESNYNRVKLLAQDFYRECNN